MTRAEMLDLLNQTKDDSAFFKAVGEVFAQAAMANTPALTAVLGIAVSIAQADQKKGRARALEMIQRLPEDEPLKLFVVLSVAYTYNDEYMYSHENEPGFADTIFFSEKEATDYVNEMNAHSLSGEDMGQYTSETLFEEEGSRWSGQWGTLKDRKEIIKRIAEVLDDPDWDPDDSEPDCQFTLPSMDGPTLVKIVEARKGHVGVLEGFHDLGQTDVWFPDFYRVAQVELSG